MLKPKYTLIIILLTFCRYSCLFADNVLDIEAKTIIPVARADIWSPFGNAATLANVDNIEAAVLCQNRFAVKELSTKAAQLAVPNKLLNVGLAISSFGYSAYNENIAGISFARKFSDKLMLATQFNYYFVHFSKTEGTKGKLIPQIGILTQPIEKLHIGFQVFNPVQTNLETSILTKRIPSVFSLGGSYQFSEKLIWGIQLDKEIQTDPQAAIEIEYRFFDYIWIKSGCVVRNETILPAMGFGLQLFDFQLDTNFKYHTVLGITSNVALSFKIK